MLLLIAGIITSGCAAQPLTRIRQAPPHTSRYCLRSRTFWQGSRLFNDVARRSRGISVAASEPGEIVAEYFGYWNKRSMDEVIEKFEIDRMHAIRIIDIGYPT